MIFNLIINPRVLFLPHERVALAGWCSLGNSSFVLRRPTSWGGPSIPMAPPDIASPTATGPFVGIPSAELLNL